MRLLGYLEIVVVEADCAKGEGDAQHDPNVAVGGIGPQHRRYDGAEENHQSAHRRRALLGHEVRLRSVAADRLPLALLEPQQVDDRMTEQKNEHQRGEHCSAGTERDVAQNVERPDRIRECREPVQHGSTVHGRSLCRRENRSLTAITALQCLHDGRHAGAKRAFDHDRIAGLNRGKHI